MGAHIGPHHVALGGDSAGAYHIEARPGRGLQEVGGVMLRLAYRNLFQSKVRLAMSVGGVALALTLVLALDAIMAGAEKRLTAYIDNSEADVWVAQSGVRNLHMVSSWMPSSVTG